MVFLLGEIRGWYESQSIQYISGSSISDELGGCRITTSLITLEHHQMTRIYINKLIKVSEAVIYVLNSIKKIYLCPNPPTRTDFLGREGGRK
jgi:hypothetical protein